jgi:hypothetical protein
VQADFPERPKEGSSMFTRNTTISRGLTAAAMAGAISLAVLAPAPAEAAWHGGFGSGGWHGGGWHGGFGGYRGGWGGWHGGWGYRGGWYPGAVVGGALLGLGVGAALAAPYYYAPPPAYYPPPAPYYAPPPGYAPPPPQGYYPPQ